MSTAVRLAGFGAGLVLVFAGAFGAGAALGGSDGRPTTSGVSSHGGHSPAETSSASATSGGTTRPAKGLTMTEAGYTFSPRTTTLQPGRQTFAFTVSGTDGQPVQRYQPTHEKEMHLIVVRRDLTGFQHLHPVRDAAGAWTVPVDLPATGAYRVFADFRPDGKSEAVTLGVDVTVPGQDDRRPAGADIRSAVVDGYTVTLDGDLVPGAESRLSAHVSRGGAPVTDLQPYLGAYGHLVVLRHGDLAYLHVHPDGTPGDGVTRPGPAVAFSAHVPSEGTYRLFLDFQHGGQVRTAVFTLTAATPGGGGAPAPLHGDGGPASHAH